MPIPPLASDTVSIVIRGDFKPVSISPKWLLESELIGQVEYGDASYEVVIPNEVAFFQAGWLRCQANVEALLLQTDQQEEFERLRDVAVGILRLLPEKRISLLGINKMVHISVKNFQAWHAVGDRLVHNDIWQDVLTLPGMRSVIYWSVRSDNYGGRIQLQIEPSGIVQPGIFVAYNDHYDLSIVESQPTSRDDPERPENADLTTDKIPTAIQILNDNWEDSAHRAESAINRIWLQAKA